MHTPSDFRSFLQKGDTVTLFRKNQPAQPMTFTVRGIVGSGSTAVCYLAEANGQRGRLKEFYPVALSGLSRSGNGMLYLTEFGNMYLSVEITEQVDLGDHTLFIGEVTKDVVLCDKPSCTYDHYLKHILPKK